MILSFRLSLTMSTEHPLDVSFTPDERLRVEQLAEARGTSIKDAILDAVSRRLDELRSAGTDESKVDEMKEDYTPSGRLRGAGHLIGCMDGPEDLSTNDDHLEGYGA